MKKKNLLIVSLSFVDENISGGDKIYIEFLRNLKKDDFKIDIVTNNFGFQIYNRLLRKDTINLIEFHIIDSKKIYLLGYYFSFLMKIPINYFRIKKIDFNHVDIVLSTSDFLSDILPSIRVFNKYKTKIIGSFFLKASKPFDKDFPYRGVLFINGFFYWILQLLSIHLINKYINNIIICSSYVKKFFYSKNYFYIPGGVKSKSTIINHNKKFTACFYARFHPQKGPDEIIKIWSIYVKKYNSHAKLLMIGDGPLFKSCIELAKKLHIESNIKFTGYILDDNLKSKYFNQSKILVHPAIYDTGGMAALEVMSFGLPGISYDLEGLKETYPIGMMKVKCFDKEEFAKFIDILDDNKNQMYDLLKKEVLTLSKKWDWKKRAQEMRKFINEC